jgi:hypothetical protein
MGWVWIVEAIAGPESVADAIMASSALSTRVGSRMITDGSLSQ